MSATLTPPIRTTSAATHAPAVRAEPATVLTGAADPAAAELHRWLVGLTTPFVLGALFYALSIALSAEWLIGVSLVVGPMLFMFMTIYLCISSDANGEPAT